MLDTLLNLRISLKDGVFQQVGVKSSTSSSSTGANYTPDDANENESTRSSVGANNSRYNTQRNGQDHQDFIADVFFWRRLA